MLRASAHADLFVANATHWDVKLYGVGGVVEGFKTEHSNV